jgi:L,D-transpeptidase ErfK/SrfK
MSSRSLFAASILLSGSLALSACVFMPAERHYVEEAVPPAGPDPSAPRMAALEAKHFTDLAADSEVLGDLQVLFARYENTLVRIARKHDLGLDELQFANPGVDIWLPGEATPIYLPTMSILPDAPRDGIVLNLPAMRLLYFTSGEAGRLSVTSHPVGIGREGWATPTGTTEVSDKVREPTWYPPASVRAEHAALGDPLPSIVPPGPDNPLGHFALDLSLPGYLIHGTNKPAGVGMRVSHGCIRLFPEDIEALFERVPRGTPVYIVDQPVLAGWRDDVLYLEVHRPLNEDGRDLAAEVERVVGLALERAGRTDLILDPRAIDRITTMQLGMPFPISGQSQQPEQFLATARIVENDVPIGSDELPTDAISVAEATADR